MDKFKLALLCDPGCEDYASLEVEELLKKKASKKKGYVIIDDCTLMDGAKLCYFSQSASRILVVIHEDNYDSIEDFSKADNSLKKFDYKPFHNEEMSFRVSCNIVDEDFDSQDLNMMVGELIHDSLKWKVDLNNPNTIIYANAFDGDFVIGIDLSGRALEKREYKIYHSRKTLRGTIAYSLLRFSGFNGKGVLLDPFCLDGSICIETALFSSNFSVNHYNPEFNVFKIPGFKGENLKEELVDDGYKISGFASQLKEVKNSRANAKIAGIDKKINISKIDVSWLDTKLKEKSVDFIVTYVPESGKSVNVKDATKIQEELFWQADYVLAEEGVVCLLGDKIAELTTSANNKNFELVDKKLVLMGKKELWFLKFKRSKKSKK